MQKIDNQQPSPLTGEGSTTISQESTGKISGKRWVYHKVKNVIYKITNTVNNKIYIGSASFYDKRIATHRNLLIQKKHKNPHLQLAWNKYGEHAFNVEIVEYVNCRENLLNREQYWLDYYQSYDRTLGYNCSKFAGSNLGNKLSEETKRKIGLFWKGKKHSEERKLRTKERATKLYGKTVIQYTKNMEFIAEFPSISEAARATNLSVATISRQCSHKLIGHKFTFRYKDMV